MPLSPLVALGAWRRFSPVGRRASGLRARGPRLGVCAAVLLLSLTAAPHLHAQLLQPADPGTTPGWVFTPSMAFSLAWDDNVALSGHRAPTASDTVLQFTPSGEMQYRGRYNWVAFGYTGSIARYRTLAELNSYDQQARVDSRHQISRRVSLQLHNGLAFMPTTDAVMVSGVPFLRTGSRLYDGRAELQAAVARHTTVRVGYNLEWVSFDRDNEFARFLKGGIAQGVSAGVEQAITKRVSVGAQYTFRRASISNDGGEFDINEGAGTITLQPTETLTLAGSLGFSRLGGGLEGVKRTGLAWSASATQRLHRATVRGGYSRSFVPSFGLGGTIQNEELDGSVRMPVIGPRVYWQLGVSWRRNDPITAGEQSLKSLWLHTTVGLSLQRWLRIEGYVWRSQQDSQLPGGRVDRNRLGVQLIAAAPVRVH